MLLRKVAKADIAEVEKEEGSSNAGKTVRAQGRAHLPNRFHQRFFGLARPKSACRPFAQIKKFCFPRIVCSLKREVLFWTTQRTLASTFALGCRSKAGIRKGSSCTLSSLAVRSGRGPGPIWRSSRGLRLFYRQTPSQALAHRHVQKRDCT